MTKMVDTLLSFSVRRKVIYQTECEQSGDTTQTERSCM